MSSRQPKMHIQLEPEQQQALAEIALHENRSVSEIVQEMVNIQLEQRQQSIKSDNDYADALARIARHRQDILNRRSGKPLELDPADLINQMRDERDLEILGSAK